jgi:hypothetical protein
MIQSLKEWWSDARKQYSGFFLGMVFLVYWMQGLRTFAGTATFYVLKEEFQAPPSVNQAVRVAVSQPWNIKWLYGIISDNLPLWGWHVKPYLVVSSVLYVVGQVGLSWRALSSSVVAYTAYYTVLQFSSAISDVLIDSLVVKMGRDTPGGTADLQSFSWVAFALGGILGNLLGGPLVHYVSPRAFLVMMLPLPFLMLYFSCKLPEKKSDMKRDCNTPLWQVKMLFRAFFAKPYLVLKSFTWIFLSNAMGFSIEDGMTYFRVRRLIFSAFLFYIYMILLLLLINRIAFSSHQTSWPTQTPSPISVCWEAPFSTQSISNTFPFAASFSSLSCSRCSSHSSTCSNSLASTLFWVSRISRSSPASAPLWRLSLASKQCHFSFSVRNFAQRAVKLPFSLCS